VSRVVIDQAAIGGEGHATGERGDERLILRLRLGAL
jgi:hypothetical protein